MEYLDASVAVKWFKQDEPCRKEADDLFQRIKDCEVEFVTSEWTVLEVTRALVKAGVKKSEIAEVGRILDNLFSVGAVRPVPLTQMLGLAREIEIELGLYAADAVHLATAIKTNSKILWTEDEHLHKSKAKEYARKNGVEVRKL